MEQLARNGCIEYVPFSMMLEVILTPCPSYALLRLLPDPFDGA